MNIFIDITNVLLIILSLIGVCLYFKTKKEQKINVLLKDLISEIKNKDDQKEIIDVVSRVIKKDSKDITKILDNLVPLELSAQKILISRRFLGMLIFVIIMCILSIIDMDSIFFAKKTLTISSGFLFILFIDSFCSLLRNKCKKIK
ncbi:hypothetical protein [Glaesserella sp.]|uniref:hypothetical protein n=1 Tax=Glaesserella sp. TaxID=2094731 RepID=UPI0035A15791